MRRLLLSFWLLGAGLLVLGCSDQKESTPTEPTLHSDLAVGTTAVAPGDPLPWVSPAERTRFEQGAEQFDVEFEDQTGLGPLFNEVSCAECHEDPARGGSGDEIEVHATAYLAGGVCDELTPQGGPVYQTFSSASLISLLRKLKVEKEPIPPAATGVGLRTSSPLFGLGLVDAIADATLLQLADPNDRNGDGVSGRANLTADGRVGRFGRKAVVASLRAFNDGAFHDGMGITSAGLATEGSFGGYEMPVNSDPATDPELGEDALSSADAFVQLLAPVAPLELSKQAKEGRNLFARINCTGCHVPSLKTGDSPFAALRYREVGVYSDLLLHDMGPELADVCRPGASPSEFRTQPLMGLRLLPHFMHDGRALTVTDAIQAHGGEAARSRDEFGKLSDQEKAAIVAFLNSL
jgi:CxxC motif-containing protein (DUF1111 family)